MVPERVSHIMRVKQHKHTVGKVQNKKKKKSVFQFDFTGLSLPLNSQHLRKIWLAHAHTAFFYCSDVVTVKSQLRIDAQIYSQQVPLLLSMCKTQGDRLSDV